MTAFLIADCFKIIHWPFFVCLFVILASPYTELAVWKHILRRLSKFLRLVDNQMLDMLQRLVINATSHLWHHVDGGLENVRRRMIQAAEVGSISYKNWEPEYLFLFSAIIVVTMILNFKLRFSILKGVLLSSIVNKGRRNIPSV